MVGPFYDAVEDEGELITNEAEIATAENDGAEIQAGQSNSVEEAQTETNTILTEEEIMQMKVSELRENLKARRISTSGNKAALQLRLKEVVAKGILLASQAPSESDGNIPDTNAFVLGSKWEIVKPGDEVDENGLMHIDGEVLIKVSVGNAQDTGSMHQY